MKTHPLSSFRAGLVTFAATVMLAGVAAADDKVIEPMQSKYEAKDAPIISTTYDFVKDTTTVRAKSIYFRTGPYEEHNGRDLSDNVLLTFSYEFTGKTPKIPETIRADMFFTTTRSFSEIKELFFRGGERTSKHTVTAKQMRIAGATFASITAPMLIEDFQMFSDSDELFFKFDNQTVIFRVSKQYMDRLTALSNSFPKE